MEIFENVIQRADGSFVITKDGYPFHVPNEGEFAELWAEVNAYATAHPDEVTDEPAPPEPTPEELYNAERAVVEAKYSAPWNGTTGGVLTLIQMTMTAALCEVPQDAAKITALSNQYQTELANMNAEFTVIDQKYGVE